MDALVVKELTGMKHWCSPSRLHFQLVHVLVPVHTTDVLQLPLPLWSIQPRGIGAPDDVRGRTHLDYILVLQVLVFWAAN